MGGDGCAIWISGSDELQFSQWLSMTTMQYTLGRDYLVCMCDARGACNSAGHIGGGR
jgi:hypothetical protein